jgi:hypothetical protein
MLTDVAPVVVHDNVAELPAVIVVGLTPNVATGIGTSTINVAVATADPVLLVAVSV